MEHTIQSVGTSPEELKASLLASLKPQLDQILEELKYQESPEQLLTREKTAELLSINPSTLWKFTKLGILQSYNLPGTSRIYYKRSEILEAIQPI